MFLLRRHLPLATRASTDFAATVRRQESVDPRPFHFRFFYNLFLPGLLLLVVSLHAQQYPASTIPEDLKKDADAVVRLREFSMDLKSPAHAIVRERVIITVLNEHGDNFAQYRTYYDKMTEINSVEGFLYDAAGKELKHFKKKDMIDRPLVDGMSLATDGRIKENSFSCHAYPYTVLFEEEDELNGIVEIEDWLPQQERNTSVESSRYSVTTPKGYVIRYKMLNADLKPVVTEIKDRVNYQWEIKNIKPVSAEVFCKPWTAMQPRMLVGPSDFEAAGYKGNMTSWEGYGKFYSELDKGRDVLPNDTKAKVHALVDAEPDERKKINLLYDYLQKNTHYISIQLGIGGLQPFDATNVSKNKYGDCKALSNFMKALLKEAGIKAYLVRIRAGKNETEFEPDFPGHQFNHVICCVPIEKDTVWLECTDQYLSPGYLSNFTANRYGLLITEDGGKLVHTPDYALTENKEERNISASLDQEGNLKMRIAGLYRAERQDELEAFLHHYSRTQQSEYLKREFDLPTYDVPAFDYQLSTEKDLPVMRESLEIIVNNYAQVSGKRLFINPDLLTRSGVKFSASENRQKDLLFQETYSTEDSVEISIPDGYTEESRPKDQSVKTPYGEYRISVTVTPGKIVYHRRFEQFRGAFPATAYGEASKFYNGVYKSDRDRVVLVKKQ